MAVKLTKKLIDTLKYEAKDGKKDIHWDEDMAGFGLRIYPSGKKAFIVSYRQDGVKRLFTLGQYGKVTLEQARDLAKKKFGDVADGRDPLLVKKAARKRHEWNVARAFNLFIQKYAKVHNKQWKEKERIFDKDVLPFIGTRPIDEITKSDIVKILDRVSERDAGVMANRTLAAVRKFFNWCLERDLIKFSPAFKVAAPVPNPKRDRVLKSYEIKDIWHAAIDVGYPFGDIARFLILTGQRRGEVAQIKWSDIDEETNIWTIPKELTKNGIEHKVPLSAAALEILRQVPNLGTYVFTSAGERPFENFSRDKVILDQKINAERRKKNLPTINDWRIHDFRRTMASGMAELKVQPYIIERILNHTGGIISGVAAVYNRYQYAPEMKEALGMWARKVETLTQKMQNDSQA